MKKPFSMVVDQVDLDTWRGAAQALGLSLSEWIRRRCNRELELRSHEAKNIQPVPEVVIDVIAPGTQERVPGNPDPASQAKEGEAACAHGTKRGWNCWLCGEIVG